MIEASPDIHDGTLARRTQDLPKDLGGLWIFGLSAGFNMCLLFQPQLGGVAPVLATLLLVLYCALAPREAFGALASSPIILVLPALALISVLWSAAPRATLYYGVQYLITVLVGMMIGGSSHRRPAIDGLFVGWAIFNIASLLLGQSVEWGNAGASAFAGMTRSKNFAGDNAALGAIFAMYFIISAITRKISVLAIFGALALLCEFYVIAIARSSGSILGVTQSAALFVVLCFSQTLRLQTRMATVLAAIGFALVPILTYSHWGPQLVGAVLEFFGKDATLTGRTYLWYRADQLIAERPFLGIGYAAFWQQGNVDAEGLWRYANIVGRAGFNFHNSAKEMLVSLGWVGLVTFASVLFAHMVRLFWRTLTRPDLPRIVWTVLICYEIGRMPYEAIGLGPFAYATVLIAAAMAGGAEHRSGGDDLKRSVA